MSHRESLKIHSIEGGVDLDVWFYKPVAGSGPFPVVVAGHGCVRVRSNDCVSAVAEAP